MDTSASIADLAQVGLFLPELITRGLSARDRVMYYVSLLEAAETFAQTPTNHAPTLRAEREASGIADAQLDQTVAESRATAANLIRIPGACVILDRIFSDVGEMLQPLRAVAAAHPEIASRLEIYQRRLDQQIAVASPCTDDQLTPSAIEGLARRSQNGHDSVHQLVVDLQWELNRLDKAMSPESVDGALAYGLTAADRTIVQAFMRGVNQTRGLKFDRAGLGTSALRDGDRLSIQNDLGPHDPHVFVVHVRELAATVVYTDRHRARARFFHDMLAAYDIQWDAPPTGASASYETSVGRYTAENAAGLERFLTFVGSRLVFLIDWNRARKRLARFVKNTEAVGLLKWAADNNVGHHAFLQAGDARLVYTALERTVPAQVRFGARLDDLLGGDLARLFLTSVLGIVAAGLRSGRSARLIEDEVEAELLTHLRTTDRTVLGAAADHATVVSTIAEQLRHALTRVTKGDGRGEVASVSEMVTGLEARADEIVRRSSRLLDHTGDGHHLRRLLSEADDAADLLEEAAFLLTLVPVNCDSKGVALLEGLADLVSRSAREYLRCIEDARDLSHGLGRPAIEQVLITVEQLAGYRQQASVAERAIRASVLGGTADCRELYVSTAMARGLEQAAHTLARCGLIVRDYVLNTTSGVTNIP